MILLFGGSIGQVEIRLIRIVEEGHQAIKLGVGNGVVLMRVALAALHGQAQPGGGGGAHTIHHGVEPELQGVNATLFIEHGVTMKAGGHYLAGRGVRKQVTCKLLNGEPIKRHVGIQSLNHPVAIGPDAALAVLFVAVRIGITGKVQPASRPAFAVVGRREQLVHEGLIALVRGILDKGRERLGWRWKSRQIQGRTPGKRGGSRSRGGFHTGGFQLRQDERIDGTARPARLLNNGQGR